MKLFARTACYGLALSPHAATAVRLERGRAEAALRWDLAVDETSDATWTRLSAVLAELHAQAGDATAVLHVALLPPLAQLRRVELPKMGIEEARHVLTRDAARYFSAARDAQYVDVRLIEALEGGRSAFLAAAAPRAFVDRLHERADLAGWRVGSVSAAASAWAAGLRQWPRELGSDGALAVLLPSHVELVHFRAGEIDGIRRFPSAASVDAAEGLPVGIVGADAGADEVRSRVLAAGGRVVEPLDGSYTASPAALAAAHARGARLGLLPSLAGHSELRMRRRTGILVAASALLLAAAGGVEMRTAHTALAAATMERARLRPQVSEAANARSTLEALRLRFAALSALESGPRWPVVVASVAQHLPPDAHLTAFRAEGDSLVLEGEARRASAVFDAVRATPGVVGVHASAPVRREFSENGAAVERFALTAGLGVAADANESAP
ncbi:MAG TPA: PilN domain-containing protein [Longimicrobiaceae bacterium]|nr:PilN domain-containing protein [Longimicrobiaceae bacterium]